MQFPEVMVDSETISSKLAAWAIDQAYCKLKVWVLNWVQLVCWTNTIISLSPRHHNCMQFAIRTFSLQKHITLPRLTISHKSTNQMMEMRHIWDKGVRRWECISTTGRYVCVISVNYNFTWMAFGKSPDIFPYFIINYYG